MDWNSAPAFGRRETLLRTLQKLAEVHPGPVCLVETGTLRDDNPRALAGDGWSTLAFGWYAAQTGGRLYTVDCDPAALVDLQEDLRTALPPGKWLGMGEHASTMPPHLNAGVIYLRNTPAAVAFLDRVWEQWPVEHMFEEQVAIGRTLTEAGWREGLAVLDARWNSTFGLHPADGAVVRAWHGSGGVPQRYAYMHALLEEVRQREPVNERASAVRSGA